MLHLLLALTAKKKRCCVRQSYFIRPRLLRSIRLIRDVDGVPSRGGESCAQPYTYLANPP
nr:hypothetical protein Q903MT_gene6552 [Picea sitchensis]